MVSADDITFSGGLLWLQVLDVSSPRMPIQVALSNELG
jgi:hypothetical protein